MASKEAAVFGTGPQKPHNPGLCVALIAAALIAAALLGHRIVGRASGGAAGPEDPSASRTARRVLVGFVVALHAARAARRARRGGVVACGCAPVFVKACVKACVTR